MDAAAERLDALALELRTDQSKIREAVQVFLGATVAMPVSVTEDGKPRAPLQSTIDGVEYILVATGEQAAGRTADQAPYGIPMTGADVIRGLAPGMGIVVNATVGAFTLPPDLVDRLRGGKSA